MAPFKALLLENIHPSARDMLVAEGFEVEMVSSSLRDEELVARLHGVHVLGIRSKTQVRAPILAQAKDLLTLGCFCIGVNQVDLAPANALGVPVFNAPFSNTRSVAEMILAEVVMLARQLGDRSREVHSGVWKKVATSCFEIRGKTLGIIGYGHIGRQVGVLAEMFGMRVVFFDVLTKLPMGNNQARQTMDEVLAESDFVTLHVPETTQTREMIGEAELHTMKQGSYLLNASRGTVVEIPALAQALQRGHLGGAAIDVYPEEPEANGQGFASELRGLANVVLTPHIGGSTAEAQASIGREVATSLVKFVKAGATTGAVNFPVVEVPLEKNRGRILNVHTNVPGVMRDVSRIVAARDANIHAQVLATDASIGYLVMDLDATVAPAVAEDIKALATDIKTRVIY